MAMKLTSPAFGDGATIPAKYTCEGEDISPALSWLGVPEGRKVWRSSWTIPTRLDSKAPQRTWVHWVVYDMDPASSGIAQGGKVLPQGARGPRSTTGTAPVMVVHVRPSGSIGIFINFTL